jgi:hypothetical protein
MKAWVCSIDYSWVQCICSRCVHYMAAAWTGWASGLYHAQICKQHTCSRELWGGCDVRLAGREADASCVSASCMLFTVLQEQGCSVQSLMCFAPVHGPIQQLLASAAALLSSSGNGRAGVS